MRKRKTKDVSASDDLTENKSLKVKQKKNRHTTQRDSKKKRRKKKFPKFPKSLMKKNANESENTSPRIRRAI